MRYKYVILGVNDDMYMAAYSEVNRLGYAEYKSNAIDTDNKMINLIYKAHTTEKINKYIRIPFQQIWNPLVYHCKSKEESVYCFVFFAGPQMKLRLKNGYVEYLKQNYKGCRTVLFCQDMIKKSFPEGIEEYKKYFDLIVSFDHQDSFEYNLVYHPLVYSAIDENLLINTEKSDVYFVGKAKDRLGKIIAFYEQLSSAGLKCDFFITGVQRDDQKYRDKIHYCEQMPYIENVSHIKNTKCLLEVMQGGGHGYTLRYCEAIMYDKKIITDNPEIVHADFFDESLIQVIKDNRIDCEFVNEEKATYRNKELISPKHLLMTIDKELVSRYGEVL